MRQAADFRRRPVLPYDPLGLLFRLQAISHRQRQFLFIPIYCFSNTISPMYTLSQS